MPIKAILNRKPVPAKYSGNIHLVKFRSVIALPHSALARTWHEPAKDAQRPDAPEAKLHHEAGGEEAEAGEDGAQPDDALVLHLL